jgi:hypothetical protein
VRETSIARARSVLPMSNTPLACSDAGAYRRYRAVAMTSPRRRPGHHPRHQVMPALTRYGGFPAARTEYPGSAGSLWSFERGQQRACTPGREPTNGGKFASRRRPGLAH